MLCVGQDVVDPVDGHREQATGGVPPVGHAKTPEDAEDALTDEPPMTGADLGVEGGDGDSAASVVPCEVATAVLERCTTRGPLGPRWI